MYPQHNLSPEVSRRLYDELAAYTDGQFRLPEWVFAPTTEPQTLGEADRILGLAALWAEAKVSFAYWDNVPDLDWDAAFRAFIPRVSAAADPADYYLLLRRFVALLRDGHTYVTLPAWLEQRESTPPVRVYPVEGLPVVMAGAALPPGTVITAVDGQPAQERLTAIMELEPASTEQDRLRRACLKLLSGPAESVVAVTGRRPDGREVQVELARSGPLPAPPLVEREDLGGGRVLIRIGSWMDPRVVERFHAAVGDFAGITALVIDLRRNGGGNSDYGKQILARLVEAETPTTVDRLPGYVGAMNTLMGLPRPCIRVTDPPVQPDPTRPRFSGPVMVLTSFHTYSASEDFCVGFRNSGRGLLIGEPTGGSTGNPAVIPLPGGGRGFICAQRSTYPDGSPFVGRGVQPHIYVAPTIAGVAAGRDEVLERALAELAATGG